MVPRRVLGWRVPGPCGHHSRPGERGVFVRPWPGYYMRVGKVSGHEHNASNRCVVVHVLLVLFAIHATRFDRFCLATTMRQRQMQATINVVIALS